MLYRFIKKFRKVICLLLTVCISVPLVSACGPQNNGLSNSRGNYVVGKGGSIEAYTTYREANFMPMDREMYHSYLLSSRDFILVLVPDGDNGDPQISNLMFQAAYSGVTPYNDKLVDVGGHKTFSLKTPEYKLLIYYATASEFLSWDQKANQKENRPFIVSALDFMTPVDADNVEIEKIRTESGEKIYFGANVIDNEEDYNLRNVVNSTKQLSECEFLRVKKSGSKWIFDNYDKNNEADKDTITKCDKNKNREIDGDERVNIIADVANVTDNARTDGVDERDYAGITLLFGDGSLTGYFTIEDLNNYNFENVGWLNQLFGGTVTAEDDEDKVSSYIKGLLGDNYMEDNFDKEANITMDKSIESLVYKWKYDMALLGRIKKIHYNTILDFEFNSGQEKIEDVDRYYNLLQGTTVENGGNYITLTTADGFIMDRGNLLMNSGSDLLFDTNFVEFLTQMDACTNRTLASYVVEFMANTGISVGAGLATAGVALTAVAVAAKVGLMSTTVLTAVGVSSSVAGVLSAIPVAGWIAAAAILLATAAVVLYVSISSKKAIEDAASANFCKVYESMLDQIQQSANISVPIYQYNIGMEPFKTLSLCYGDVYENNQCKNYAKDKNGNKIPDDKGNYVYDPIPAFSIPGFRIAKQDIVKKFSKYVTGAPSLRLYSKGKFVDEIYGAGSPQYLYAILDSWGVTASRTKKYNIMINNAENVNYSSLPIAIYDMLGGIDREYKPSSAVYCVSEAYGEECSSNNKLFESGAAFGTDHIYSTNINVNDAVESLNYEARRVSDEDLLDYKQNLIERINNEEIVEGSFDSILNSINVNLFDGMATDPLNNFKSSLTAEGLTKEEMIGIVNTELLKCLKEGIYKEVRTLYLNVTITETHDKPNKKEPIKVTTGVRLMDAEVVTIIVE